MNSFFSHLCIIALIFNVGCITTSNDKKKEKTMNELVLQEDLQRFYTRFTERIVNTIYKKGSVAAFDRKISVRQYWLYDSESLKIATGPFPVANLLDMLVFIKLNKIVIQEFWIPKVYGDYGRSLLETFEDSENDLENIALRVLTPKQYANVDQMIKDWRGRYPGQIRVERFRFADFSKYAKGNKKDKSSFSIVDTSSAVEAVDQMVLVANRGIFLAQQMPSILRINARIGTQEILSDTVTSLQSSPYHVPDLDRTNSLIDNTKDLVIQMDHLVNDTHSLMKLLPKNTTGDVIVKSGFDQIESILDKAILLTTQLLSQKPLNKKNAMNLKQEFYGIIWFVTFIIMLIAVVICTAWWTGAYIYKRHTLNKNP